MCTSHTYIYIGILPYIHVGYCWITLLFRKKNKQTHFDRHHRIPSFHWFGDSRNINHGWGQRNLKKPCQSAKVRGFLLGYCMISLIRLLYWKSSRIHKRFGLKQDVEFLVGGLEHGFYDFPIILGISSSQLTKSIIFQFRGIGLNHQPGTELFLSGMMVLKSHQSNRIHWSRM